MKCEVCLQTFEKLEGRGRCRKCYHRLYARMLRHGKETLRTAEDRFWEKVDKTPGLGPNGDCWEWRGDRRNGYGSFAPERGERWYAHRLVVAWAIGTIPDGMFVMHKCDNPPCVRLAHLRVGSEEDNRIDMYEKGRAWWQRRKPVLHS